MLSNHSQRGFEMQVIAGCCVRHQPPVDVQDEVYQLQEGIVVSADTLSIKSFQESVIAFDGLSVLL